MASDLAEAIAEMPLSDTHEHHYHERHYVEDGPNILQAIANAERLMQSNQRECLDLDGTRAAIRRSLAEGA